MISGENMLCMNILELFKCRPSSTTEASLFFGISIGKLMIQPFAPRPERFAVLARLARRLSAFFTRFRPSIDRSRLALTEIDPSDLSEAGRRVRIDVLRELRRMRWRAEDAALSGRTLADCGVRRGDIDRRIDAALDRR
jgi:hypothetical protein